jgi:hypothetical protein
MIVASLSLIFYFLIWLEAFVNSKTITFDKNTKAGKNNTLSENQVLVYSKMLVFL